MRLAWPLRPCDFNRVNHQYNRSLSRTSLRRYCPSCVPQSQTEQPLTEIQAAQAEELKDRRVFASPSNLFALHTSSPGSPIFQPSGTHIIQKLQAFLRAQYPSYGFQEILTPIIYKKTLWETSGHWNNYKDDMFMVTGRGAQGNYGPEKEIGEDEEYGLKPMNCPGHCLLFKSHRRSYKDLPIRYADFSPLHRNELSGALSGLTRLRRFHQDDGHIFCRHDQIKQEITMTLEFVQLVYQTFGLGDYKLRLGTRPEQFIGSVEDWDTAERRLKLALEKSRRSYTVHLGDGAFYGPKIDILLTDANGKDHQTATIQLDFQLPKRFNLEYDSADSNKKETPVLIHRAILGSLERFMALLMESYRGKWPFWMSPRQLVILTVGGSLEVQQRAEGMARQLACPDARPGAQTLIARNFMVDCDTSKQSIGKKIIEARKKGYSFYAVVGERNLKHPQDRQSLDLSLASHPNEKEAQDAIQALLQSQIPASQSKDQASPVSTEAKPMSLTIQQCQELMTELNARFL